MDFPKLIVLELRNPRTKDEAGAFGQTCVSGRNALIFVNARKNRNREELMDTLLHELFHAAVGLFRFSTKGEEKKARTIGRLAAGRSLK